MVTAVGFKTMMPTSKVGSIYAHNIMLAESNFLYLALAYAQSSQVHKRTCFLNL
jgi:hypothetical protein